MNTLIESVYSFYIMYYDLCCLNLLELRIRRISVEIQEVHVHV